MLDRATTMGQAGKAATAGTTKVLDDLRTANRDVFIDLAATDPNCDLQEPWIASGRVRDGSVLCRAGARQPGDRPLRRWNARELQPSLAVIQGISAYLGAVDAVVTRKPVDIAGDVADAEAKLRAVAADLYTIAGTPALPDVTQEQRKAIEGTLNLLSELLDEAQKVGDLRRLEQDADQQAFERNLAALAAINESAIRALGVQLQNQIALTTEQLRRLRAAKPDDRRPIAARQMDLIDMRASLPALQQALDDSVEAFDRAQADYRALLLHGGALTPAERRKAAAVTQARVLGALHNLASIVAAF